MKIDVNMRGKIYGGYTDHVGYSVAVDYDDFSWDAGDDIDFDKHKDMAKQIESALLGKRANANIKGRWPDEVIVYKGESIARLHVQKILLHWSFVDFGKSSLADKIRKLRRQCTRRVLKSKIRENRGADIQIEFCYDGDNLRQQGGSVIIPAPIAKWLGKRLIEASSGDLQENGRAVTVDWDGNLKEKKSDRTTT